MNENIRSGNWSKATISEYESCNRLLLRFLGDTPVNHIDYEAGRQYKTLLTMLPMRFLATKKYDNMTMEDVIKLDAPKKISTSTVNKQLTFATGVFNYAHHNHYMDINPIENMHIKQRKKPNELVAPFDNNDLIKIFHSDRYMKDKHYHNFMHWMPILGLFTGARIGELAQIKTSNLKHTEDGIWYLDIEGELKSDYAERKVPLHPYIIEDLKFPEYVKRVKAQGHEKLFWMLKPTKGRWGHTVTNWFTRYKENIGLTNDDKGRRKSFHSFRHTFTTYMKHEGVSETMIKEVIGHSVNDITMGRYGDKYPVKKLYEEVILKFTPGIDLDHLKSSKYSG